MKDFYTLQVTAVSSTLQTVNFTGKFKLSTSSVNHFRLDRAHTCTLDRYF